MAPALCAAWTIWFCSCCWAVVKGPERTGLAPRGWSSSPSVPRGGDSPWPSMCGSQRPALPPTGLAEGGPLGWGKGSGSHDAWAGQPAVPSASEAHGSLQSRYLDPLRDGEASHWLAWPGSASVQQALMGPRWEPGAVCAPTGFESRAHSQAGPARELYQDTVWLQAGPEVAGIPRRGTGLSRAGSSLCERQSRTPEER